MCERRVDTHHCADYSSRTCRAAKCTSHRTYGARLTAEPPEQDLAQDKKPVSTGRIVSSTTCSTKGEALVSTAGQQPEPALRQQTLEPCRRRLRRIHYARVRAIRRRSHRRQQTQTEFNRARCRLRAEHIGARLAQHAGPRYR